MNTASVVDTHEIREHSAGGSRWYRDPRKLLLTVAPIVIIIWALTIPFAIAAHGLGTALSWGTYGAAMVASVCLAPRLPWISLVLLLGTLATQAAWSLVLRIRILEGGTYSTLTSLPLYHVWPAPLQLVSFGLVSVIWTGIAFFAIAQSPRGRWLSAWVLGAAVVAATLLTLVPLVVYYGGEWRDTGWWFGHAAEPGAPIYQTDGWPPPIGIFLGFAFAAILGRLLRSAWIDHAAQRTGELISTRWQMLQARREHALAEERQRIAGEVHDTLAHSLTVVLAQAEGALRAGDTERTVSLGNIATVSRSALRDVRALIERLDAGGSVEGLAKLTQLDALFAGVRAAGPDVEVEQSGSPLPLGDAAESAVYRIVQEALTNALKHGDPDQSIWVSLAWPDPDTTEELVVTVVSGLREEDGPDDPSSPGRGIEGMALRARLLGGSCTSGPDAGGDAWHVEARIPAPGEGAS